MKLKHFFILISSIFILVASCKKNDFLGKKSFDEILVWQNTIEADAPGIYPVYIAAVDEQDNIYVPATNNPYVKSDFVYSFTANGTQRWKKEVYGSIKSRLIYYDDKIYFASYSKDTYRAYITCLNAQTGAEDWIKDFEVLADNLLPLAVSPQGIYFAASDTIFKLSFDGNKQTKLYIDSDDFFAINVIDNSVYVLSTTFNNDNTTITKLIDNGSFEKQWEIFFNESCNTADIASDSLGNIFFATDEYLYSVTPDGQIRWKKGSEFGIRSSVELLSFAIGDSGIVLAGSGDFFKLTNNGTILWKHSAREIPCIDMYQAPTIGKNNNFYYVEGIHTTEDDGIRVYNTYGELLWYTNKPQGAQNAILLHNGNLVFQYGNIVYCIKTESGGLRECAYPKIYGDYGNTGYRSLNL